MLRSVLSLAEGCSDTGATCAHMPVSGQAGKQGWAQGGLLLGRFGEETGRKFKQVLVDFPQGLHFLLQVRHLDLQLLLVSHQVLLQGGR